MTGESRSASLGRPVGYPARHTGRLRKPAQRDRPPSARRRIAFVGVPHGHKGQIGTVTRQYSYKDDRSDQSDNASTDSRAPDGRLAAPAALSPTPTTGPRPVAYDIDIDIDIA